MVPSPPKVATRSVFECMGSVVDVRDCGVVKMGVGRSSWSVEARTGSAIRDIDGYVVVTWLAHMRLVSLCLTPGALCSYRANSSKASVAGCEQSFFSKRMLRGGDGQRNDKRSLPLISNHVSRGSGSREVGDHTMVGWLDLVWKLREVFDHKSSRRGREAPSPRTHRLWSSPRNFHCVGALASEQNDEEAEVVLRWKLWRRCKKW